jgi:hypothetical protein
VLFNNGLRPLVDLLKETSSGRGPASADLILELALLCHQREIQSMAETGAYPSVKM